MSMFGMVEPPTAEMIRDVARDPAASVEINAAIRQSVQEAPAPISGGVFYAQTVRGAILPPYGTKERDRQLRLIYRNEYNTLIQGTTSSLIKKFVTVPWEIKGDQNQLVTILGADGRRKTIRAVEHYQLVLQNAQFGAGYEVFASRLMEDFFCQDFGGAIELIGPGEPVYDIQGPVSGVAHLDAGRCYITGNPYYPILYYSLISGSLHRMHTSRVMRFVDMPSPDERFFNIGLCALSRAIAVANRQQYMSRYIEERLDDRPPPGIMTIQGMTQVQREKAIAAYVREQQNDLRPVYGRTLWFESVNVDMPIKVESIPFSVAPEKFDWPAYNSLDVDAVALAFGVDRQEIWELAGKGLGSAGQSEILAEKARGKMFGFILQNFERGINRRVLPPDFEFAFKYKDEQLLTAQAAQDFQAAQTIQVLAAVPNAINPMEARQYLANTSDRFKDIFSDPKGTVTAGDSSEQGPDTQATLEDDNPINISQQPQQGALSAQSQQPISQGAAKKAFGVTSQYFIFRFLNDARLAIAGKIPRREFEANLLDTLSKAGTDAYIDGLKDGGVTEGPDEDEQQDIQTWLMDQIDFIDSLSSEIYGGSLTAEQAPVRARMWVNKSLTDIRDQGRIASDKNSMYKWVLGQTEKHCPDCARLNGQVHRYKDWYSRGWLPKADKLHCKGYQCDCQLMRTDEKAGGRF